MAIIIPSKNIYELSNDKILKNVIERIEVNATDVVPNNEFETSVYNETFNYKVGYTNETQGNNLDFQVRSVVAPNGIDIISTNYAISYIYEIHGYYKATIRIDRNLKNKYISRLYNGVEQNSDGEEIEKDFVNYSVSGTTKTYPTTFTIHKKTGQETTVTRSSQTENKSEGLIHLPTFPIEETITNTNYFPNFSSKVIGLADKSYYKVTKETDNYYEIEVMFLAEYDIERASGIYYAQGYPENIDIPIEGTHTIISAKEITITAYGNTVGIDLQNKTITISEQGKENSKKVFSLDNNELLQTSNYVTNTDKNAIEVSLQNTLNAYKNGKETATILCDINEYKDESGNLAISTKQSDLPMTFNIGDEVIPMIFGANGKDMPMSKKDGNAKVFVVVSVKPYYDGAVWQEIEIQEKTS